MHRICPRRSGLSLQKKPSNPLEEEQQMMKEQSFGASSNAAHDWKATDWPTIQSCVRRLQLRIAKAIRAGQHGKAKALSWLLTHSRSARLLAVRQVTENKGAKTPGVDNLIWLSEQKTVITHIATGFNFLGQNVRKYGNKRVIKPAKDGTKALVQKVRECIKRCIGQTAETLIRKLNPILRGWANYHRYICSAKTFWTAGRIIQHQLLRWARRTHPNKSYGWLKHKCFAIEGEFGFAARVRTGTGESKVLRLYWLARTVLERHINVRGDANPYDPDHTEYFERRRCFAGRTLPRQRIGKSIP